MASYEFADRELKKKLYDLRAALHACPEKSGAEIKTRALLMRFLQEHTTMELERCGGGFYAAHRETQTTKGGIALRADYDALALPGGGAKHLCGHDGHAAALCGTALMLEGKKVGRNVFLLFQPAEETGVGAKGCLEIFEKESVDEIYGAHNLPGVPLGKVTTRPGAFACGSNGLILYFKGAPAHAAYPEDGRSPAEAIGQLLCELKALAAPENYSGMVLCTVIGVSMGEKAFGAAPGDAEIWLTLRAEHETDLHLLNDRVCDGARKLAEETGLGFSFERQDVFPATENEAVCAEKVLRVLGGVRLKEPMRWSEDFGHYLQEKKGAFFGIGAGEDHAPLHTKDYEYPDELLLPAAEAFRKLILA